MKIEDASKDFHQKRQFMKLIQFNHVVCPRHLVHCELQDRYNFAIIKTPTK